MISTTLDTELKKGQVDLRKIGQLNICSFMLSFRARGLLTLEVLKRIQRKITAVMFPPTLFFYVSSDSVVIHKITFLYKRDASFQDFVGRFFIYFPQVSLQDGR